MTSSRALLAGGSLDVDRLACQLVCLAPDGAVLDLNAEFAHFAGIAAGQAQAPWVWSALLTPHSHERLMMDLLRRSSFVMQLEFDSTPLFAQGAWLNGTAQWVPEHEHYVCVLHDVTGLMLKQRRLESAAQRFELLAGNVPVWLAYFDASTLRCKFANEGYAKTFGLTKASIVGRTLFEIVGPDAAVHVQARLEQVLRTKQAISYIREMPCAQAGAPSGVQGVRWLDVHMLPQFDRQDDVVAILALISDITRHRLAERVATESQERLKKFMQASAEGIVFYRHQKIIDANPAACALVGYDLQDMLGCTPLSVVAPEHQAMVFDAIHREQDFCLEAMVRHKDGRHIPVELMGRSMVHNGERVRMAITRDISERLLAQEQIRKIALHDGLTGLPNRPHLSQEIERLMHDARRNDTQFALMFIDLDHFKRVNDSLGHLVGDSVLQTIAQRIIGALRADDFVARFGGDEFIVLQPKVLQSEDAESVAKKLLASIEEPVQVDGRMISVTPSIGIAIFPRDAQTADELIKNADMAMYRAKSSGRANFQFFRSVMGRVAFDALVMESQLTQGLAHDEFVLYFQPQVSSHDGELVGAEALVRWMHPERGLLLPAAFIGLAEQQRLMLPLGQWVLEEAARCAKSWAQGAQVVLPVAVNLSSTQFRAQDFISTIEQLLEVHHLSGDLLELELTERMLLDDLSQVKNTLHQLKDMGIRIAVDDFGTGYSSLSHLKSLPIDKMKIDRSFVQDLPTNQSSVAIARAIVQMAASLGITVIAEGVETFAQRQFLTELGVHELQGILISPPLSRDDFDVWLAKRSTTTTPARKRHVVFDPHDVTH